MSCTVKLMAAVDVSWAVVWFGIFEMVGGSFTALTVTLKLVLAVPVPSLTVRVMVVAPDWLEAGWTLTVRLDPEPPKRILAFGTRSGFEEVPERTRLVAGVSASPIVSGKRPVAVSSLIVWFAIALMVG